MINRNTINVYRADLKRKLLSIPMNDAAFRELNKLAKDLGTEAGQIKPLLDELCEKGILLKKIQYICPSCRATTILSNELLQEEIGDEGCIECNNCMSLINPEKDKTGFIYYDIKNREALIKWQ